MRIDLPLCNLKNCRYSFDGNCTRKDKYDWCEYTLAKKNAFKALAETLKSKSQLVAPSVYAIPYRAVAVEDIDKIVKEMTKESE